MPTHSRNTILLATDQQRSVLIALNAHGPHPIAYTPYGHRPPDNGLLTLLGFNGEPPDPLTGCYHLGNGYRQFNPVLMRFHSPDSWSPFGQGGLNAYGYCLGNPITGSDRTGHTARFIKSPLRWLGLMKKSPTKNITRTLASSDILEERGFIVFSPATGQAPAPAPAPAFKSTPTPEPIAPQGIPSWQKNRFNSKSEYKQFMKKLPVMDSKGQVKAAPYKITDKTPTQSSKTNEEIPTAWTHRQEIKLARARLTERHSHNSSEVEHYRAKLRKGQ